MRTFRNVLVLALLLAGSAASAEAPENDPGMRQNCVGDYFRFCSGYMPGTIGIRRCFGSHMPKLTPECRGAIQAFDRRDSKAQN